MMGGIRREEELETDEKETVHTRRREREDVVVVGSKIMGERRRGKICSTRTRHADIMNATIIHNQRNTSLRQENLLKIKLSHLRRPKGHVPDSLVLLGDAVQQRLQNLVEPGFEVHRAHGLR